MEPQEMRAMVDEALREHDVHHPFRRRAPLSKHTDPDGKTWYSGAVSRVQAVSAVLALLASIFAGIWASMGARDQLVVYPEVDRRIDVRFAAHDAQVRREMDQISPQLAKASELALLRQDIAVLKAQTELILEQLNRIEPRQAQGRR